jgi:hypothetical protein
MLLDAAAYVVSGEVLSASWRKLADRRLCPPRKPARSSLAVSRRWGLFGV